MVTQVNPKEDEKKSADMDHMIKMQHSMPPQRPPSSTSPIPPGRLAPIMTNSTPQRPPSVASVHSVASGSGPPRTTATSRRGGRTRCRSPPTMGSRPGSRGPMQEYPPTVDDRSAPPPSPANPSAAAAAAAAAAKSLSNGRTQPPPSSWQYEAPEGGAPRDYGRRPLPPRESVRYHTPPPHHMPPGTSSLYPPHRSAYRDPRAGGWPPEEDGRPPSRASVSSRYGHPSGHPSMPLQPMPTRREDQYGYRGGADPSYVYRGARGRGDPYGRPPYTEQDYDRRYGGDPNMSRHVYDERMGRGRGLEQGPPPGYGADPFRRGAGGGDRPPYMRDMRDEGYRGMLQDVARGGESVSTPGKRTTRVIGTATPIHVPRASEQAPLSRAAAASVFRGRPGVAQSNPEESNPQKVLMSIQTPTTSFEEKASAPSANNRSKDKQGSSELSPHEPPRIQHSHHPSGADSSLFFEPTRSPKSNPQGTPQPTNSLDMAPSFSLFNQSFDSLGDGTGFFNVGGPLDSALQSSSFGGGLGSDDNEKGPDLQLSSSGGNSITQQLLGGSSSGVLNGTFGMSPSNSFGNGPPSRGGNMMLLGGEQTGSSSPSQVLNMYQSYSGGGSPKTKQRPLEDRSMHGGPHIPNPPMNHSSGGIMENPDGSPLFYAFLKRNKDAFKECSFLLPGLKAALLETPGDMKKDPDDTPKRQSRSPFGDPSPHDAAIASRRVASAVCAFGGTFIGDRALQKSAPMTTQSIFREKTTETATVTPSSSTTSPANGYNSRPKSKYDEALPGRYYENDNRLSWEFEEDPPIEAATSMKDDEDDELAMRNESEGGNGEIMMDSEGNPIKQDHGDSEDPNDESDEKGEENDGSQSDQPKMRYRCKLCGQPKQNHTCPYQQSLARSIGIQVYPAVNAFTSTEPGVIAPALSEMNNFIGSGESISSTENSPNRPTPDRMRHPPAVGPSSAQVTPESLHNGSRGLHSPITSITTSTPQRTRTPGSIARRGTRSTQRYMAGTAPGSAMKKRSHSQMNGEEQGDLLFVESADLKPEQFRIIAASKKLSRTEAFTYPALPLPYAQRKRLSDNLFSLSKEVPQLTDECAAVLREARERDMWDLAVAELMTQVVIVANCSDGDNRFEGLRRYLLTLGISC
ncbi:unnamed protein product [Cylindrotheca closterium]|uniref:Uncharacterized protein n=1 Tax=Cylindrotheca closterium TaxID=2856 RepID=A0AAD2GD83_9STRA|nr:unnamed protein product [Cylindrotheca closterium]